MILWKILNLWRINMNRKELNDYIRSKIDEFSRIDARIVEIQRKLTEVRSMENDSLIQINIGICVFSISKESAEAMLQEALQIERNYHLTLQQRFNKAVGILNGEDE